MKSEPLPESIPTALTIAGSDSGGGAGIQADLKTFHSAVVHGTCAITCITAQSPRGVRSISPVDAGAVADQIAEVCEAFKPQGVKTGMLYSASIIRAVVKSLKRYKLHPVVDPVMISTSGAELLLPAARQELEESLFPLAALITPNLDEAAALLRIDVKKLREPEAVRAAARLLYNLWERPVLVKGGHLKGAEAMDIFYDGETELLLSAPYIQGISTHGTGCVYSAAIVGAMAWGAALPASVRAAKEYISGCIADSQKAGKHWVLGC